MGTLRQHLRAAFVGIALSMMWPGPAAKAAAAAKAQAAARGDEGATLQVVQEEKAPDFLLRQYSLAVLAHYSYLIASDGEALIVDPDRDVARYLADMKELQLELKGIYLTHTYADLLCGHTELAQRTDAPIYISARSDAAFPHRGLHDGEAITFGKVRVVARETPGCTMDSTCLFVYCPPAARTPRLVLTGDTLFVNSVGRPDLAGGSTVAARMAGLLYRSWQTVLAPLPDGTRIYPAHGAGSLCGVHIGEHSVSTIGEQRSQNPYLVNRSSAAFVMAVLHDLPPMPQYFRHDAEINRRGPPLVNWDQGMPPAFTPVELKAKRDAGAWVVDLRSAADFADAHVPGSLNIGVRGRLETWTGTMVPWGAPFVLVGSDAQVREAAFRLHRIGYDKVTGYLKGGVAAWEAAGLPVAEVSQVSPVDLYNRMEAGKAPVILDVREPREWREQRIGDVLNLPVTRLRQGAGLLDPTQPVLTVCDSGYRSSLAAGILEKLGFRKVELLAGGTEAWVRAGLPTLGTPAASVVTAAVPQVYVDLPERISPEVLASQIMDLPKTFDIVDIRPPEQFHEFSIPGSVNVPIHVLLNDPSYRVGRRPLVIVSRDGSVAAAVAGALCQQTDRPVRVLVGGVERYYDEIMRPKGIAGDPADEAGPAWSVTGAPASGASPQFSSPSRGSAGARAGH